MKPLVKWAGGKTRLLEELTALAPRSCANYYEPMCGGAAFFWSLGLHGAVIADINPHLINMYEQVARNPLTLCDLLARYQWSNSEEFYYNVRDYWNDRLDESPDYERAAMFIYLNKTCYNGLWRVNSNGSFNVPYCRDDDVTIYEAEHILAASKRLQKTVIRCSDYRQSTVDIVPGTLVYFDPPYDKLNAQSFTAYTPDEFDHAKLATWSHLLVQAGGYVMLSNNDTAYVRSLYSNPVWTLHSVNCTRPINSDGARRGKVPELIITGGY